MESPFPLELEAMEDFGRDKDLKALLKILQPKTFTGEGADVPRILEEWLIEMEDYFALAKYNPIAQGIMGKAKLMGPAKSWWKLNCQSRGVPEITQGWEELKYHLKERYFPLNYETTKMNEFLSCTQRVRSVGTYYEEFIKLSRYAPLMSEDQKLCRFILGLEGELADEVDALRPFSLADALVRAKAKLSSLSRRNPTGDNKKRHVPFYADHTSQDSKVQRTQIPSTRPLTTPHSVQVNALPITQSGRPIQCYNCQEWGHKKAECPKGTRSQLPRPTPVFQNKASPQFIPLQRNHVQPIRNSGPVRRNFAQTQQNCPPLNVTTQATIQAPRNPPKATTINHVSVKEELEEQAHIYAALDPSGQN